MLTADTCADKIAWHDRGDLPGAMISLSIYKRISREEILRNTVYYCLRNNEKFVDKTSRYVCASMDINDIVKWLNKGFSIDAGNTR